MILERSSFVDTLVDVPYYECLLDRIRRYESLVVWRQRERMDTAKVGEPLVHDRTRLRVPDNDSPVAGAEYYRCAVERGNQAHYSCFVPGQV